MTSDPPNRPLWVRVLLVSLCGALIATFIGLGNWQIRRLSWKVDLIDTVEARAFDDPVPAPRDFREDDHAYLRVRAVGTPLDHRLRVKAVTDLGPGHWIMRPLRTDGGVVWVNRGFVSPNAPDPPAWTDMPDEVEGLIRPTEPLGTFLESNDPASNRWVSRDTQAMSEAVGIGPTLPYFIDADHVGAPAAWPRGGMTILNFRNTHLSYALTWYAMAALLFGALIAIALRSRAR